MSKLIIEVDLAADTPHTTRILLDGEPVGAVQHVDFSQGSGGPAYGRLFIYDMQQKEELWKQLAACPWLKVLRLDPKTHQPKG